MWGKNRSRNNNQSAQASKTDHASAVDRSPAPSRALSIVSSQPERERLQIHDDQQFVHRLKSGDTSAFTTLATLYSVRLEEYVRRQIRDSDVAADVVQDVFVDLWERRTRLNIRTTLQGYLYAAARNRVLLYLRRARLEERSAAEFLRMGTTPANGEQVQPPDVYLQNQQLAIDVRQALDTLSPRVREVALLRWRDKLSRSEIADILGVTVSTVHNQLTTAVRALRPLLADNFSDLYE